MTQFFFSQINTNAVGVEKRQDGLYYAQVLKCGEFLYDDKPFQITPESIKKMVVNFERQVKGAKVPLNWRHDDNEDLGWVHCLVASKDGQSAYAAFEVTEPKYKEKIDNGTVCFTSSEIDLNFQDEKGAKHGPVFEGLALTNRPFLRGMDPISVLNFEEAKHLENEAGKSPSLGGPNMDEQERLRLEQERNDLQKQVEALKAEAAAAKNKSTESAIELKLEEAKRQIAELTNTNKETTLRVRLENVNRRVKRLTKTGRVTAHVGGCLLTNLTTILTQAESTTIKFGEKVNLKKLRLSDDDDDKDLEEETVDKLDMVDSILDTLESLPAAVAMEDDDDDEPGSTKMEQRGSKTMTMAQFEQTVVERADELIEKAGSDKLSFDQAVSRARAELRPKVRIVKGRSEEED